MRGILDCAFKTVGMHPLSVGRTAAFALLTNEHLDAIANLPSYYAIILYDGDRMGEWFSGTRFNAATSVDNDKYNHAQAELSRQLMEFAERVSKQAERFRSATIYAGGDEGLIFAPIDFVIIKYTCRYKLTYSS